MTRVPIGQIVRVVGNEQMSSELTGEVVTVKDGDTGFVDSRGIVHYTSGEAYGTVQKVYGRDVMIGYDHVNIAQMISDRLDEEFTLKSILEDQEVEYDDLLIAITEVLTDIL